MLNRARIAAVAALLVGLLGCAANQESKPSWSEATGIDVSDYSTFGWEDRSGRPPVTILDNQIRDAIRAQLLEKGYVETTDAPDFQIHHEPIEQEVVKQGSPVRIGIGIGTRSGNIGGSVGSSVDVGEKDQLVQQMRIEIRAIVSDDREAWVGTTGAIAERPDKKAVESAVASVMRGFPDRRP